MYARPFWIITGSVVVTTASLLNMLFVIVNPFYALTTLPLSLILIATGAMLVVLAFQHRPDPSEPEPDDNIRPPTWDEV